MNFTGFIGPSYISPSAAWNAQRAINLFLESDESGTESKTPAALLGTPGLTLFATLPNDHIRGIWTGLADNLPGSSAVDACYLVAGSKLCQVFSNGTYSVIGDIGDDATHSPATFIVNGGQIFVTSAGLGWIYDGYTLERAFYNNGIGVVNTAGTAVTYVSGDVFDASLVGEGIIIGSTGYVIGAYVDQFHITLATSAGTLTNAIYKVMSAEGTLYVNGTGVAWVSGQRFAGLQTGDPIIIGGIVYVISSVALVGPGIGVDTLVLTTSGGAHYGIGFQVAARVAASMSTFLDGYGIVVAPNSKTFAISDINDFRRWSPLDFGRKSAFPDNIASILADHEELWLFGSETTEIWFNSGGADFPMTRNPSGFIAQGIRAPFSAASLANGVAWIGGDARGNPIAWLATGFQPGRISTHGVETAWATYSTITDAVSLVYTMRGHQFWQLSFPTANATWTYDYTAKQWHERGWWNGTSQDRTRYATHGYVFGKSLVGDWENGKLYELSDSIFTDEGVTIHRIRTAPHLSNDELFTFYAQFRLACQIGLNPTLSWSDDQGVTWHAEKPASGRKIGGVTSLSTWRRLGKSRDRVWRITITDTVRVALFAAYLDLEAGVA